MGKYSGQQDDAELGRDGDAARKSQRADDGRQLAGGSPSTDSGKAMRRRNQRHEVCLKYRGSD
jgi:hypothetical protein